MKTFVRSMTKSSDADTLRRLRIILGAIGKSDDACSLSDGETYICSFCETPIRECRRRRGQCCPEMIRQGTLLDLLRRTGITAGGVCVCCGAPIADRSRGMFTEICSRCRERVHVVQQP